MISRRGIALRWRIAIFSSLAIAFLSLLASVAAYAVVRSSLVGDLQRSLGTDAARIAAAYTVSQDLAGEPSSEAAAVEPLGPGDLESVATGGLIIQLYDGAGVRFAASDDEDDAEVQVPTLPAEVLTAARTEAQEWRGELRGDPLQAALVPFTLGVVAVLAPTDYIGAALGQLAQVLTLAALVLVGLSALLGYLVAAAAARPVTQLAAAAAQLDPARLEPIRYRGPDDEVALVTKAELDVHWLHRGDAAPGTTTLLDDAVRAWD